MVTDSAHAMEKIPVGGDWVEEVAIRGRRVSDGCLKLVDIVMGFINGSYDGASDLATAEFYNPLMNRWTAITPMGTKRSCLGL